jgi:predicted transcriptional regulator
MTRTLTIGIASYEDMKARTLAIARGTRKRGRNEPKVWFTSLESLAKVLSAKNQALLELIAEEKPDSLAELEKLSGRAKSNLSRTLKTMERYGFVELSEEERRMVPRVLFDRLKFEIPLHVALPTSGADGRHGARKTPSE